VGLAAWLCFSLFLLFSVLIGPEIDPLERPDIFRYAHDKPGCGAMIVFGVVRPVVVIGFLVAWFGRPEVCRYDLEFPLKCLAVADGGQLLFAGGSSLDLCRVDTRRSEVRYLEREESLEYDLRLMSSVKDVSDIPAEGKALIIVADVDIRSSGQNPRFPDSSSPAGNRSVLYFRMFDRVGKTVVSTHENMLKENKLKEKDRQIADLRKQLEGLWPPHALSVNEKRRVITAVTSIVGYRSWIDTVACSEDGRLVVSGRVIEAMELSFLGGALCHDRTTDAGEFSFEEKLTDHPVRSVAISPDGRLVLACSVDLIIYNRNSFNEVGRIPSFLIKNPATRDVAIPRKVVFSPDGSSFALGSYDGSVSVWETESRRLRVWCGDGTAGANHTDKVEALAFAPDGKVLASGSSDGTVQLWDGETGRRIGWFLGHHPGGAFGVAFSPDGRRLASGGGDGTIRLWDVGTGREVSLYRTVRSMFVRNVVTSVAFSHDGTRLFSAGLDGTVRIWKHQLNDR
jgi:WD40 repeat protein